MGYRAFRDSQLTAVYLDKKVAGSKGEDEPAEPTTYAAKVACGVPVHEDRAPGQYFTSVNVRNAGTRTSRFRQRVVTALSGGRAGDVSGPMEVVLAAGRATLTTCQDMAKALGTKTGSFEGFLTIESETPLDVVAVHSAHGTAGSAPALHTERVAGRPARR